MGDETADRPRYHAFISYSHRDAAFGRRLHRRLESYRLPRRLVGRPGRLGPAPARLSPIFRDREELSAAGDLTAEVRAALAASATLVVVCSPSAAASPWVGREIETFRALHPDRPVLAAVVSGEPADCFPQALRIGGREPLAADFRKLGDGPRLGLLKLAAGIAGVGLDELVQRDAQRQVASVTAITAGALVLTLVMAAMTAVALDARAEAERQRAEAEGLVGFMLTDLRDRLEGVTQLEVLTAVNKRALTYYARQDLERLPPSQLEQRAKLLQLMGEDDRARGDLKGALAQYQEAYRVSEALLAADPGNPKWIFRHAQSEYGIARIDYDDKRYPAANTGFLKYRALADSLVKIAPANETYLQEVGFAEGNLCSIALTGTKDVPAGLKHCSAALAAMEAVAKVRKGDSETLVALGNRHAWLADAYKADGNYAKALEHRLIEGRLLDGLIAASPRDMGLKEAWVGHQRALAKLEVASGRPDAATSRLRETLPVITAMVAFDPKNEDWARLLGKVERDLSKATSH